MVPRGTDDNSVVVGPHIRGSRLRASAAGDEEVDLLLPGTARYDFLKLLDVVILATPMDLFCFFFGFLASGGGGGLFTCCLQRKLQMTTDRPRADSKIVKY